MDKTLRSHFGSSRGNTARAAAVAARPFGAMAPTKGMRTEHMDKTLNQQLKAQSLPSLRDANFHGLHMPGRNLVQADFRGANSTNGTLTKTILTRADLRHVRMGDAHLVNAKMAGSDCQSTQFYSELG